MSCCVNCGPVLLKPHICIHIIQFGAQKGSISTYRSEITVTVAPPSSKKYRTITPKPATAHQTVTRGEWSGRSWSSRGLHKHNTNFTKWRLWFLYFLEEVTAHAQSDSFEDAREICADGITFQITYVLCMLAMYRMSQKECARLRESVPYVKVYRYNPKTYIQSWTVTEIMAREVWNFDRCYTLIDYQIHIKTGRNMWFL